MERLCNVLHNICFTKMISINIRGRMKYIRYFFLYTFIEYYTNHTINISQYLLRSPTWKLDYSLFITSLRSNRQPIAHVLFDFFIVFLQMIFPEATFKLSGPLIRSILKQCSVLKLCLRTSENR